MYPNLYYVFKDFFGVDWNFLRFVNSFGFFVAVSFILSSLLLANELKRKSKQGLFHPTEEKIVIGKPATLAELITNFLLGFVLGYKILGLFLEKEHVNAQDYIFSLKGNLLTGILLAALFAFLKWRDKNKHALKEPETRTIRVWPQDRIGEMTMIALVLGLIGAKVFDTFENWDAFLKDPSMIFSASGLTFYGGLICAGIGLWWYTRKHNIPFVHFLDVMGPVMMMAYGLGRIGCHVAGDGDWGIFNSAYKTTAAGGVQPGMQADFDAALAANANFFAYHGTHHAAFTKPAWLNFLPDWFLAYDYPHNVNEAGVKLAGCTGEYCNHLPVPVFPTPLYEIIVCLALFGILMLLRKQIKIPGVIFSIYLIFNGLERFFIEKIRVNVRMNFLGMSVTQAELIAFALILLGIFLLFYFFKRNKKPATIS